MNMYEEYLEERQGLKTIKTDSGFICYRIEGDKCLIAELFVKKNFRLEGKASFFADQVFQICKEMGVRTVFCQTDEECFGHDTSRIAIEQFGFRHYEKDGSLNHYQMGVAEWEAHLKK